MIESGALALLDLDRGAAMKGEGNDRPTDAVRMPLVLLPRSTKQGLRGQDEESVANLNAYRPGPCLVELDAPENWRTHGHRCVAGIAARAEDPHRHRRPQELVQRCKRLGEVALPLADERYVEIGVGHVAYNASRRRDAPRIVLTFAGLELLVTGVRGSPVQAQVRTLVDAAASARMTLSESE